MSPFGEVLMLFWKILSHHARAYEQDTDMNDACGIQVRPSTRNRRIMHLNSSILKCKNQYRWAFAKKELIWLTEWHGWLIYSLPNNSQRSIFFVGNGTLLEFDQIPPGPDSVWSHLPWSYDSLYLTYHLRFVEAPNSANTVRLNIR